MAIFLIDSDVSLVTLHEEMSDTQSRLEAQPLTLPFASVFDPFFLVWQSVFTQEQTLNRAQMSAMAGARVVDASCNTFIGDLDRTLLGLVDGRRDDPLYVTYFAEPPSAVKQPFLGDKVTTMQAWLPLLQASPDAPLKALATRLSTLLDNAVKAIAARTAAAAAIKVFRASGERKSLFDQANGIRKDVDHELALLPLDHPELHLPAGFGQGFFRPSTSRNTVPTLSDLDDAIMARLSEVDDLRAKRAQMVADLTAAAQAEADAEAAEAKAVADKARIRDAKATSDKSTKESKAKSKAAKALKAKVKGRKLPATEPPPAPSANGAASTSTSTPSATPAKSTNGSSSST